MPWTTREHWYWGFILPGRFPLLFLSMGILFAFAPWIWVLPVAVVLVISSLVGISGILFQWQAFSLSLLPGGRTLVERNGTVIIAERRISLTMVGSMTFEQSMMGRLFDYGNLKVGAMGGPYQWENLGHFRTLRRIIESQGEWMPPRGNALTTMISRWIRQIILLIGQLRASLIQIIKSLHLESQTIGEYLRTPSYRRFVKFAEEMLFPQSSRQTEGSLGGTDILGIQFTTNEIRIYQRILRIRRLIISDDQGRTYRHRRIHTFKDIRRRVPISWFRRAVRSV